AFYPYTTLFRSDDGTESQHPADRLTPPVVRPSRPAAAPPDRLDRPPDGRRSGQRRCRTRRTVGDRPPRRSAAGRRRTRRGLVLRRGRGDRRHRHGLGHVDRGLGAGPYRHARRRLAAHGSQRLCPARGDRLPAGAGREEVWFCAVAVAIAGIVMALGTWIGGWALAHIAMPVVAGLRTEVVDSALSLESQRIEVTGTGDLVSRVADDSRKIS